jgi:hypothetical protein
MTEAVTSDLFAIYSLEARRRDVALLAEALELDENCDADKFCAALGAAELAQRRQAALTGQWKVRQDTEMLLAALAKAREELASAELAAQRLAAE